MPTTISDNWFARVTKESIVRDPNNTASLTWNDIAYSTTETINEKIDSMVVWGGWNSAIQFKDEGVALWTAGSVDEVDFTGAWVTTTRASNKITVNIPLGGWGVTDHGALTWLTDDDHTQYTKADGTRAFTGKQSYSTHPTFSSDTELVDKKYVDDSITAWGWYTDEQAQDSVWTILVDSATIDFTYNDATPSITWSVIDWSINTTKLGWNITAAGKALLDDADASAQRTTLWLGTLSTQNGTFSWTSSGTNTGDETTSRINALYWTTNAFTAGSLELWHATDTTISRVSAWKISVEWVNVPTISSTDVLTNKTLISTTNVISENTTTASSATPTPTGWSLRNYFSITALAASATFSAPSGTPVDGNMILVRIKDNGTARTLAWNAIYRGWDTVLPTTTIISKTMYLIFVYNGADAKWDLVSKEDNH